jgi:hypothetical protein
LVAYPILCRGSSFTLKIQMGVGGTSRTLPGGAGGGGSGKQQGGSDTVFLESEFYSPYPDEVAEEIAIRLATRIENSGTFRIEDVMEI